MLSRTDLHDYQRKGVEFIEDNPACALWLGMGMGKTATTLTATADLLDAFDVSRALIVGPLRVANTVWKQEAANWSHTAGLDCVIATGSAKERSAALSKNAEITIINRENIPWLVEHYGKKWPFDLVVLDEASSFKNHTSKRFKALRKVRHLITRIVELTGTPSSNGLLDLWAQIYLLDGGERLGRSMTAYRNRYFDSDYMGYKWTPKEGAEAEIYSAISDIVISMEPENLSEPVLWSVPVEIPNSKMAQYRELEKEFLLQLEEGEIEAFNAAALAGKLLQYCNGAVYTDDSGAWTEIHNAKLDALADIIEDNPNESILVAYNFKSDLARLKARFPQAVVLGKGSKEIEDWNNGKIKLLLAHPASAGHGLNLQHGGSFAVWFGLNWSLELYQQFNKRLDRQGQKNTVRIAHLVMAGGIDQRVMRAITDKAETQADLIKAVQVPIKTFY